MLLPLRHNVRVIDNNRTDFSAQSLKFSIRYFISLLLKTAHLRANTPIMMQCTYLRFLGDALLSCEQFNNLSSSSVNISTNSCVKTTIEENDGDYFLILTIFPLGHQQQKIVQKKKHNIKILP